MRPSPHADGGTRGLCKARGQSLHEKLESLFWQHGYHAERTIAERHDARFGRDGPNAIPNGEFPVPPKSLGGILVAAVRDYESLTLKRTADDKTLPIDASRADMVILDMADEGNYIAVRPSGTEPKVKY